MSAVGDVGKRCHWAGMSRRERKVAALDPDAGLACFEAGVAILGTNQNWTTQGLIFAVKGGGFC